MTAHIFLDTNILIYALDPAEPQKRTIASDLPRRTIADRSLVPSPQNLNEAYRVLIDRHGLVPEEAVRAHIGHLVPWCIAPLDATATAKAWQ